MKNTDTAYEFCPQPKEASMNTIQDTPEEIKKLCYYSGAMYFVGYDKGVEVGRVYIN
jgi:hypothetical protein